MFDFIFDNVYGWWALAALAVAVCGFAAWYFPPLRGVAIAVGAVVLAAAGIYTKGQRDRAAEEKRKRDAAVRKAQDDYRRIDEKPGSVADTQDKMNKGRF